MLTNPPATGHTVPMTGTAPALPSQPLAPPAAKTASGGKICARRFASRKSARNPAERLRKIRPCGKPRVGHLILGSIIGRAIAGQVSAREAQGSKDASTKAAEKAAQAKASSDPNGITVNQDVINAAGDAMLSDPRYSLTARILAGISPDGQTYLSGMAGIGQSIKASVRLEAARVAASSDVRKEASSFVDRVSFVNGPDAGTTGPGDLVASHDLALDYDATTNTMGVRQYDGNHTALWVVDDARTQLLLERQSELNLGIGGFLGVSAGGALLAAAAPGVLTFGLVNAGRISTTTGFLGEIITGVPLTVPVASGAGVAALAAAESATVRAARLGAEGEQAVGLFGPKVGIRIPGANNLRFPDNLTTTTLTEVKNVASQGLTKQLRDYITVSQSTGRTFDLYIRPSTRLTSNLEAAVRRGEINLKYIPGAQ